MYRELHISEQFDTFNTCINLDHAVINTESISKQSATSKERLWGLKLKRFKYSRSPALHAQQQLATFAAYFRARFAALTTMCVCKGTLRLCMPWFISVALCVKDSRVQEAHMLPIKKRT
jgi:hypothetical protein